MRAAVGALRWRPAGQARPLRAWRHQDLEQIREHLRRVLSDWIEGWGIQHSVPTQVLVSETHSSDSLSWQSLGTRSGEAAWLALAPEMDTGLANALWAIERVGTPVVRAVCAACRRDLSARLRAALRLAEPTAQLGSVPDRIRAWSGAIFLHLPLGAHLLLEGGVVHALLQDGSRPADKERASSPPVVHVSEALAYTTLPLTVRLADSEVELGALQALQVGDVVRLRHPLDQPMRVHDAAGHAWFGALLARRGSARAVELSAPNVAPATNTAKELR